MMVTERTPVGDIVAKQPRAANLFERHQIDYCCGGDQPLGAACQASGVGVEAVLEELGRLAAESSLERDWTTAPLVELAAHIVSVHHAYLKGELPVLEARMAKVVAAHGERHGESLFLLSGLFASLKAELEPHLRKEELVLFPVFERYEQARAAGLPRPVPPFGSVQNPIAAMSRQHDEAGATLRRMRQESSNYEVPSDGCATYRALFEGLVRLEADLHRHIHLENNILFPRAVNLEASFE